MTPPHRTLAGDGVAIQVQELFIEGFGAENYAIACAQPAGFFEQRTDPHCSREYNSAVHSRKYVMSTINKDQTQGRMKEAGGAVKELAGKITGNDSLKRRGQVEKTLGKAQAKFGDVKQDVKDAVRNA